MADLPVAASPVAHASAKPRTTMPPWARELAGQYESGASSQFLVHGNIADRLRLGAVADFFDFHIGEYHWPAFNIADSFIFIGVVVLLAISMFMGRDNPKGHH